MRLYLKDPLMDEASKLMQCLERLLTPWHYCQEFYFVDVYKKININKLLELKHYRRDTLFTKQVQFDFFLFHSFVTDTSV